MTMWILIAIPLTCGLCALLARPRRPRLGNEVEELVYTRLLGRQQRLLLLACTMTVATLLLLVLSLPRRIDRTLDAERYPPQVCVDLVGNGVSTCYIRQRDGMWVVETMLADGKRRQVGVVAESPTEEGAALHIP
jgi:hypothetical protein